MQMTINETNISFTTGKGHLKRELLTWSSAELSSPAWSSGDAVIGATFLS